MKTKTATTKMKTTMMKFKHGHVNIIGLTAINPDVCGVDPSFMKQIKAK